MQILAVGSETHVCNATECIIAVQGHFRSTKVVDFGTNRKPMILGNVYDNDPPTNWILLFGFRTTMHFATNRPTDATDASDFVICPVHVIAVGQRDNMYVVLCSVFW